MECNICKFVLQIIIEIWLLYLWIGTAVQLPHLQHPWLWWGWNRTPSRLADMQVTSPRRLTPKFKATRSGFISVFIIHKRIGINSQLLQVIGEECLQRKETSLSNTAKLFEDCLCDAANDKSQIALEWDIRQHYCHIRLWKTAVTNCWKISRDLAFNR